MNRFIYFFAGMAATLCLILTSSAHAQGVQVTTDADTSIVIGLVSFHEFHVTVSNKGFGSLTFYVERSVNELPDDGWMSAICMGELCYSPDVSRTDAVTIAPGQSYKLKLNVFSGEIDNTTGHFTLKFVSEGFGGGEFGVLNFIAKATTSSSVPTITEAAHRPFPNPAVSSVTIPLTAVQNASQVALFSVTGTQVALFDGEVLNSGNELRVNTADLAPGLYYYTITGSRETRNGSFTVVK